jgi:hypothetical protein
MAPWLRYLSLASGEYSASTWGMPSSAIVATSGMLGLRILLPIAIAGSFPDCRRIA